MHCKTVLALVVLILGSYSALATEICPKGYGKFEADDTCIPQQLVSFLYCVKKTGGGKIETFRHADNADHHSTELIINGRGSGIILSGAGSGRYKEDIVARVESEIIEKMDPSMVSICKDIAVKAGQGTTRAVVKKPIIRDDPSSLIKHEKYNPQINSVDFIHDQPALTTRSVLYLQAVSRELSALKDIKISLRPIYANEDQANKDRSVDNFELTLCYRRQLAIRKILIESGFNADEIEFDQSGYSTSGEGIRLNDNGERIEQGMDVVTWPIG